MTTIDFGGSQVETKTPSIDIEKQIKEVCVFDTFHISKPISSSCFSTEQIDELYAFWRQFMLERWAKSDKDVIDIENLYKTNTTTEQKYMSLRMDQNTGSPGSNASAITLHESLWVMGENSPTEFIAYIRKQPILLEKLRMSFKPRLVSNDWVTIADIRNVLDRFILWFASEKKHSISVIGISEVFHSGLHTNIFSSTTSSMLERLQTNWERTRFHLAVLKQNNWIAIMIDREKKTIELFDPESQQFDMSDSTSELSIQVKTIVDAVLKIDSSFVTMGVKDVRRGFRKSVIDQKDSPFQKPDKCAILILLFVYSKIVLGLSYDQFINDKLVQKRTSETCIRLRDLFFTTTSSTNTGKKSKIDKKTLTRMLYGAYDVRLAIIEFIRFIEETKRALSTSSASSPTLTSSYSAIGKASFSSPSSSSAMEGLIQARDKLFKLATNEGDYLMLIAKGVELEQDLLQILPNEYKLYAGTNIWLSLIDEIVQDPLTIYLRKISKKSQSAKSSSSSSKSSKQKSSNVPRKEFALNILDNLTSWKALQSPVLATPSSSSSPLLTKMSDTISVSNPLSTFEKYFTDLINTHYIPILHFSQDNVKRFQLNMSSQNFVKECMARKETVSFGVHFLREINNHLIKDFNVRVESELNTPRFDMDYKILRPNMGENFGKMKETLSKCAETLEATKQFLQSVYVKQQSKTSSGKSGLVLINDTPQAPMASQLDVSSKTKINEMIQNNKTDIEKHQFLHRGLMPWNFPLNTESFYKFFNVKLGANFAKYHVNEMEMRALLEDSNFVTYYARGIVTLSHYINGKNVDDFDSNIFRVALLSLLQFDAVAYAELKNLICNLLKTLFDTILLRRPSFKNDNPGLVDVCEKAIGSGCNMSTLYKSTVDKVNEA